MTTNFRDNRSREEVGRLYAAVSMAIVALQGTADQTTLAGFRLALRGIPIEAVEKACTEAMSSMQFPPKPVDIRRLAGELTGSQAALLAWTEVIKAVSGLGPWKTVSFDDGVSNAVIRSMGGWPTFCDRFKDSESEKWVRLEFTKAYEATRAVVPDEACAPLAGLSYGTARGGKRVPPRIHLVNTGLPMNPAARITQRHQEALPVPVTVQLKRIEDLT